MTTQTFHIDFIDFFIYECLSLYLVGHWNICLPRVHIDDCTLCVFLVFTTVMKLVNLSLVIQALHLGNWLSEIDLIDTYFHLPIQLERYKTLGFALQVKIYQYKVFQFGLPMFSRVFTKCYILLWDIDPMMEYKFIHTSMTFS